ncbi:unnamed protein product [Dicrocoelium dendriticum]|nr:unnamed protein product [Dicrocoelium dendriticum]
MEMFLLTPCIFSSEAFIHPMGPIGGQGSGVSGTASSCTNEPREFGFLAKLNTLSSSRRRKLEADELAAEARQAMEDPLHPAHFEPDLDGFQLAEGEERSMIEPQSKEHPLVRDIIRILIEWINMELAEERILVRDIEADLYDGQVLQKLIEKLMGIRINHPEVSQTEMGQRQRLKMVLDEINAALNVSPQWAANKWPVTAIFDQDLVAILRLLIALARRFAPSVRLPRGVQLTVLIVRKYNGILQHRRQIEHITEMEAEQDADMDHDAISALVDCAVPEKLAAFQQTLLEFVNPHLAKVNLSVANLETDMEDGVYFILLLGLLGGFYVPMHAYYPTPLTEAQRLANIQLALRLAEEIEGINLGPKPGRDMLQPDLKMTLRLIYSLYTRHRDDT